MREVSINQYFSHLKQLVSSLEKKESLRNLYKKEKKLYDLFEGKLLNRRSLAAISYEERYVFFESYYLWNYFYQTVGGSKNTVSNIELKTYPFFYVHKPLKKDHQQNVQKLRKKLGIINDDYEKLVAKAQKITKNIQARKKITSLFHKRMVVNNELIPEKVFEIFKMLFPYTPLKQNEVKGILTDLSVFFVVPTLEEIQYTTSYKNRTKTQKNKVHEFYQQIESFQFKYFENFPTFSIFDINEVDPDFTQKLVRESGLDDSLFRLLINSQTMLHFESSIEQYMIHDTWGHIWQAELAQGKVFYDELANRRVPFYPEMSLRIDQNIVAYTDLFYLNFKGELTFDELLAKKFIHQYFQNSLKLHTHALMSEMCAEITEYLFVFDYGNQIPLSSSSRFHHNPAKFDFAWSDINYFAEKLNTPYKSLLKNKSEFNHFSKNVETLLSKKYTTRFKHIKSKRNFSSVLDRYNRQFLELFEAEFNDCFADPFKNRKNKDNHITLKAFKQVLNIHAVVNYIFSKYFGHEGAKQSKYRIVVLVYIYLLFESNPEKNFWDLDEKLRNHLIPLLNTL